MGTHKQLRKTLARGDAGMALVFVLLTIVVLLGVLGIIMTQSFSNTRGTDQTYNQVLLEETAQAGIDYAIKALWHDYVSSNGNTTGNWASYRYYLDNSLELPLNEDLNFNGEQDEDEPGNGRDGFQTYPEGTDPRGTNLLDEPLEMKDPETGQLLGTVESVYVARYDTFDQARLTVRSTANVEGRTLTAVQLLKIGGGKVDHGQFAILANNISCILCHAEIRSIELENNTDADKFGTFDRIKVASLESLLVRTGSEPDSTVAGTMYTRGQVYKPNGSLYSAAELATNGFKGYEFASDDGKILQDSSGNMTKTPLVNATVNGDGELDQFANLYMDYPVDPDLQTDGPLPNSFPAPYPDDNNDRVINDEEFQVVVESATGSVKFDYASEEEPSGSVKAGIAYGVPKGSVYDGERLPTASNGALDELSTNGAYEGNLILVGTEDDPIQIESIVAVDGDLVISGPVKGEGQFLVRGNTYVVGDVTYADAEGKFGVDEAGNDNALAIIGGGSVMIGDYLTIRGVNDRSQDYAKFPTWSRYSIHARDEHRSNTYNGQQLEWGYFDKWSSDPGEVVPGKPGQQFSFTQSELQLFNNIELEKAIKDPEYVPRFYGLRQSQPDNVYVYDANDEHSVRYSESSVKKLSDYLIDEGLSLDILDRAVFHYTNPEGNWMSEDTLRRIWHDDEMTRPSTGRPFKFDGLMYSNNAIFAITRSATRHGSNTKGRMELRGGVIAADLGIFVPAGLNLQYDPRVERFLQVRDTSIVSFQRAAFYFDRHSGAEET